MTAALIVLGVLGVLCLGLICYLLALNAQLRHMRRELQNTRSEGYDRQITVSLMNSALEALAAECNENLRYQSQLRRRQQQAEQILQQSVSDIAHDLRTPLTAVMGNLQLAMQDGALPPHTAGLLAVCAEKSDLLRHMTDDFFEMALLESDHSPVPLSRVNLSAQIMQLLADNEAVIRMHGLEPEITLPEQAVFAMADAALVQRMLGNLLSNVLRYAEGQFAVSLAAQEGACTVTFANPFDPALRPDPEQIFARCYRADRARSGQGTGLGLYIVRLLAERQGAAVRAETAGDTLRLQVVFQAEEGNIRRSPQ